MFKVDTILIFSTKFCGKHFQKQASFCETLSNNILLWTVQKPCSQKTQDRGDKNVFLETGKLEVDLLFFVLRSKYLLLPLCMVCVMFLRLSHSQCFALSTCIQYLRRRLFQNIVQTQRLKNWSLSPSALLIPSIKQ